MSAFRHPYRWRLASFGALALVAAGIALAGAAADPAGAATRPANFWHTPQQAIAIADRQPDVQRLRRTESGVRVRATTPAPGLWIIIYGASARGRLAVPIEDRSGDRLELSPFAWTKPAEGLTSSGVQVEIACALLGAFFLVFFFDRRRPLRLLHLDLLVLLAFGASLAFYDRGHPLVSVPLAYPPLIYLLVRMLVAGWRGARIRGPLVPWASERWLLAGLLFLIAVRVGFNLLLGGTTDVGYASVVGADSIVHGWPLYAAGPNHIDTYGPITYLAYIPFVLIFPLRSGWQHDYLPAAHAAAITFDLLTIAGLYTLGARLRPGSKLGLTLAFAWAAYPFTFLPLALSTNDGLVPLLTVAALLALSSPLLRGGVLGLAAAAKFAPLALAGLLAAGHGDRRPRELGLFALATSIVIAAAVLPYVLAGGPELFWSRTLLFQLQRHSFMSLWGQHPDLRWLQTAVKLATGALALGVFVVPRRRGTARIAALGGAIFVGIQLSLAHWDYFYITWLAPLAFVGLFVRSPASREDSPPTLSETDLRGAAADAGAASSPMLVPTAEERTRA